MPRIDEVADLRVGSQAPVAVYLGSQQVWPADEGPTTNYVGPSDTFDGPTYAAHWTTVESGASIVGGRSRHEYIADYSEIATDFIHTLDEGEITVEWMADALAGGTRLAYLVLVNEADDVFVNMQIEGTVLGYQVPSGGTGDTYDPVAHRFWRIRETGGNLYWETAHDGRTWTTRRTLNNHGLDLSNMAVLIGGHRDGGSDGFYAYADHLNTPPPAVIATSAISAGTTLAGGASLTMPAGVQAGDLLIAWAANDNTGGTGMAISGWTQLFHTQYTGNVVSHGAWAKIATGSDTATLTGAAQDYAAVVARVVGHGVSTIATDIKVGTTANGSNAAPNPPSLNAGSTANWLWVASFGADDDDNAATWAPTNYVPLAQAESAQSTSSCMTGVAWRVHNASTEDPGAFALAATEEWLANTIAIPRGA